ncbi:hypothetical protein AA23498_2159 [Acetobacter nitrogenifigens DSM 23921 = NBRC 105050]|uniref:Uncharacterized protein n=1 Tax=Acetobacter nitrogenifigens DSM 23921 = NBRC 105050 TaxID=1120919 RepID=A0A511X6T0_9PROT|nr:hypothetical protein [Acetobacter nitrogenifigens]GBQ94962.1 hypothetical protein AA23498_2159 [Acetobacter nitrogenifigens DSM 23921 = NBRC 105050]GEN58663.1 hypothetical protein ANI02nite_05470 [Acetobacter nitrogenifigens DSM 23921 = NBRC 105050]
MDHISASDSNYVPRPPSHSFDTNELKEAYTLSLGRIPHSPAAIALTEQVVEAIRPLVGKQPAPDAKRLRDKGRGKRITETGIILAGLMYHAFAGRWAAVHEGCSRWYWSPARNLPIGCRAFWTKAQAMIDLGLVDYVPGKSYKNSWGDYLGEEARLRPSPRLIDMATACGCSEDAPYLDWRLVNPAPAKPVDQLVIVKPFPRKRNGRTVAADGANVPDEGNAPANPNESVTAFMRRLVASLDGQAITGCAPPVLQAQFVGTAALHGRIYALGADNFQSGLGKQERRLITINGEDVVEVDLSASFLSIALALLDAPAPTDDPYALPGLDPALRPAIKHWFVLFFQRGGSVRRWPEGTNKAISGAIKPAAIEAAALARYPALASIKGIVPADVLATVPETLGDAGWTLGQYLTAVEADIMRQAMAAILDQEGAVLPIHDALMVPVSFRERAQEAIEGACRERLGRVVRVA